MVRTYRRIAQKPPDPMHYTALLWQQTHLSICKISCPGRKKGSRGNSSNAFYLLQLISSLQKIWEGKKPWEKAQYDILTRKMSLCTILDLFRSFFYLDMIWNIIMKSFHLESWWIVMWRWQSNKWLSSPYISMYNITKGVMCAVKW